MKDLIVDFDVVEKGSEVAFQYQIDKLEAQIRWLWSAIDEIWESMPQEPEPPERDEP